VSFARQGRAVAFFDLDGTLLPPPSLEWRLFRLLNDCRAVGIRQGLAWLAETLRMMPCGLRELRHTNKMYLRGVSSGLSAFISRLDIVFFPDGLERIVEHVAKGHAIVLVSGTLEPLARIAAATLERELASRGEIGSIAVCATRAAETKGRWTGRLTEPAMIGAAKGSAVRRIAAECGYDLAQSFAYGDSHDDVWLLSSVGHAFAVNPPRSLLRIARQEGWPALHWQESPGPGADRAADLRLERGALHQ